jgi:hypothetical protein
MFIFSILSIVFALWVWFVVSNELGNWAVVVVFSLLSLLSIYELVKRRKKIWGALFCFCFFVVVGMVWLLREVAERTDVLAQAIISENKCVFLSPWSDGWVGRGVFVRNVKLFGATRTIRYQKDGLLRYGFLYDSKRTVRISPCPDSVGPP